MACPTANRRLGLSRIAAGISLALTLALVLPDPAAAVIVLPISQPTWAELTSQQREILMPLSGEWDQLESFRRKKWLGIAQRYPSLPPDEQNRVQQRIKAWVNLSPSERQRARDLYKSLRKAAPEERAAVVQKWQEYKELPDTEKERLRKKAPAGKSAKNPVAGNAINSQPQRSNIPPGGHPAPITPLPAATSIDAPTVKPATAHSAPQRP